MLSIILIYCNNSCMGNNGGISFCREASSDRRGIARQHESYQVPDVDLNGVQIT